MRTSPLALNDDSLQPAVDAERRECERAIAESFRHADIELSPYRHWILRDMLPADVAEAMDRLPFPAPDLNGESGTREQHNNTRRYFDADAIARHPVAAAVAATFQSDETVALFEDQMGARLGGCYLRIEFAQDTEGFWLRPHTDLGVKKFTLLYYLAPGDREDWGTDVYADADTWSHRAPFVVGGGMAFVPGKDTWHGFEPRSLDGVRKSLIVNYVTNEWRAREQLAFPDLPVNGRS